MDILNFISEELLILIPVLYLIGNALKNTQMINDRFIPVYLGLISMFVTVLYKGSLSGFSFENGVQSAIQGILIAGATVYSNQIVKQIKKEE